MVLYNGKRGFWCFVSPFGYALAERSFVGGLLTQRETGLGS